MMQLVYEIPKLNSCCVALGCFDGIHLGHRAVINSAFSGSGTKTVLSVGKKAEKPLLSETELCDQLERLDTELCIKPDFDRIRNMTGEEFVRDVLHDRLHASRVACGENYRFGVGASCGVDELEHFCRAHGIECEVVPLVVTDKGIISSTAVRAALSSGDIGTVNTMLGRRYGYCLPVVDGQHLGRTLGTPTINQQMPEELYMPRFGVYASVSLADGVWYSSVTNIGVRPTVGADSPVSETWMSGYSGNLYGSKVRVELVEFIRPERRFDSLDELKMQIICDGERSLSITGKIVQKLNQDRG